MARRRRQTIRIVLTAAIVGSQVLVLVGHEARAGGILTVNSTGDASDASPGDGTCDTGFMTPDAEPECTLRAAIEEANVPGPIHEIAFSMGPVPVPVIRPTSPLPPLTRPLDIDATTQPGFAGTPIIVIDGSGLAAGNGLEVEGSDSTIRGLVIYGFDGAGIAVRGDRNTVVGNYLGVGENGSAADGNGIGIVVSGTRNTIGDSYPDDSNVISGNRGAGVSLDGAARTSVVGNHIGVDAGGSRVVPNGGSGVVVLSGTDRATIGPGNLISANQGNGVVVETATTAVEVVDNRIGTSSDGSAPLGNAIAGIDVGAEDVHILRNQVSGNTGDGVRIGRGSAVVYGNLIGTNAEGNAPVPNGDDGIEAGQSASGSEIGGISSGQGNVIAFNRGNGIELRDEPNTQASILSNAIFANDGLGIDLPKPGPTGNDEGDMDDGPNEILNFPEITEALESGGSVEVHFDLDVPDGSYRVEFFRNPSGADPTGFGEGEQLVSAVNVRHTTASSEFTHSFDAEAGDILTATASRCTNPSCTRISFTSEFSVAVTVGGDNHPPSLEAIPAQTVDEGTSLLFMATASDEDEGDTLSFSLEGEPAGASIDTATGTFTWTPTEAQGPGSYTFGVRVADDGIPVLTDSQTVTVTVEEVNRPPRVINPGPQNSTAGETVDLTIGATDPDIPTDELTFAASGLPPGLGIDPDRGRIFGTILPGTTATAHYSVTITVTDDGSPNLSDEAVFAWDTIRTNQPPILEPIGIKTTPEQSRLSFIARANDADDDSLSFRLVGEPAGASIDADTGVFNWTPTEAQGPGIYTFRVVVTDSGSPSLTDSRLVRVAVTEVNRRPIAVGDAFSTEEDTPVTVDVLANDRDLDAPANHLRITSVTQPDDGEVAVVEGRILYTPSPNFNGSAHFDYSVGDGTVSAVGTVVISVLAVNDPPVATFDRIRLDSYLPTPLDVLANDFDPDEEPISVGITSVPSSGTVWVDGNEIMYRPQNGWVGTTRFGYSITDPMGESSQATVEVVADNELRLAARRLAGELGVQVLSFESSPFGAGSGPIDLSAITLLAESLLLAVQGLKVPLGILGLTVVMINTLGRRSRLAPFVFGSRRGHWAVARLARQQRLRAYADPGGGRTIYSYEPTETGIVGTGRSRKVGGREWLQVDTPKGSAWVDREFVTEQRDFQAFAGDHDPVRLVHELAERLRRGESINRLISPEGLIVALAGSIRRIAVGHLGSITMRPRHRRGTESLSMAPGEFSAAVVKPLLEAYDATPDVTVDRPHSRSAWIPTECWNLPYLALGGGRGAQPWLVFFEYVDGKARIAGVGPDE